VKRVSGVTIKDDPLEKQLLERVEQEWNDIVVARPLGYTKIDEFNVERVVVHVYTQKYAITVAVPLWRGL
jgi:hypothetical protein